MPSLLSAWVGLGLPAPDFWCITLREADVIMRAALDRQMRAKSIDDSRFYSLAQLISYSVNDPRKMPAFDKVFPGGKPRRAQTVDEIFALMSGWASAMKGAADG